MKCEYCGNEHDGTYGSGRFCNITCRNRFNYIKARKQFITNVKERAQRKHEEEQNTEYICEKCGKHYLLKDGISKRFCCKGCANSRVHTDETKKKISNAVIEHILEYGVKHNLHVHPKHRYCQECGIEINRKGKNLYCKACTLKHKMLIRKLNNDPNCKKYEYWEYRRKCAFTFSLREYPKEFDIKLIEQFGFYAAANNGNLNGVSRDHMYSVSEGYKNNIDPKIISHPANCKLMRHNDNVSKGSKSSITLEELLQRIKEWDLKYNK